MPANASRADRSRENQSHCETKKRPVTVFSEQMRDQKRRNEANGGEYPALPAVRIRQETERRAAVLSQYKVGEVCNRHRPARQKVPKNHELGEAIQRQYDQRYAQPAREGPVHSRPAGNSGLFADRLRAPGSASSPKKRM